MPDVLLTTINAKYAHAAFGLRYLLANMGPLRERAAILEFDLTHRAMDMVEAILARQPRIVGIGVYIWNVTLATQLVADLKRVAPQITVVLGGPEISYETEQQEIARLADYVVRGEADLAFAELCGKLLAGDKPLTKIIDAPLPKMEELALPYECYDARDVDHRVIYVEASRGCPFECEFCLSSLDIPVRNVPLEPFLAELQKLIRRGVRQFKFVDRTFNLNLGISQRILEFCLAQCETGAGRGDAFFFHFEMIPDRLPAALRDTIRKFPPGALQFEVGVQTLNPAVMTLISRRQDNAKLAENLRFIREETGVHVHADLIVGLPGEDVESFAGGFDQLVAMRPQEIQVGMLKRLRGTPIVRHDEAWGMVYSPTPPYEILRTKLIDFPAMQRLRRFAKYWDMVANSGNFVRTAPMLWNAESPNASAPSPRSGGEGWGEGDVNHGSPTISTFAGFMRFTDWLYARVGKQHGIALSNLVEHVFRFLADELRCDPREIAPILLDDYQRGGRSDVPPFIRDYLPAQIASGVRGNVKAPRRQARHLA